MFLYHRNILVTYFMGNSFMIASESIYQMHHKNLNCLKPGKMKNVECLEV